MPNNFNYSAMKTLNLTKLILLIVSFFAYFTTYSQENIIPEKGKVGLGTLNPSAKLDVNGKVHIDSMLFVKDSVLIDKDIRVRKNLKVEKNVRFTSINTATNINNKNILLIQPNGKITQVDKDFLAKNFGSIIYESKFCTDEYKATPTWMNGLKKIYTECPEVFVGINTSEPRVSLDVIGSTYSQKLFLGNISPTNSDILFYAKANTNQNQDRDLFILENNNRKIFQINNNGLVQAREIKVNLENWPDYVFDKEYKLMPLQEVEKFITQNKHLPNVPDAKTIESEGMNLGEMNKLLMEKIEELTLHLIEQEKTINFLKQKSENQDDLNKKLLEQLKD